MTAKFITYNPMNDEHLAVFRIVFSLFLIFSFLPYTRFDLFIEYPVDFISDSFVIIKFIHSFQSIYLLHFLNFLTITSAVCLLVGYKTRFNAILVSLLVLLFTSYISSIGAAGHIQLVPFTSLIFAFSGWGNKLSIDSLLKQKRTDKSFNVIPIFYLIISFSFFTSGFSKLINGWLNVDHHSTQYYLITNKLSTGRFGLLHDFLVSTVHSDFFWELLDYITVFIEILPLILIPYIRSYKYVLVILSCFHFFVELTLGIPFSFYPLLYLPFIVNWERSDLINRIICKLHKINRLKLTILLVFALVIYYVITTNLKNNLMSEHRDLIIISLWLSFFLILYFTIERILLNFRKNAT